MIICQKTIAVLAGLLLLTAFSANAQRGQGDPAGIGRQLDKPQVVTISGELDHIETGPCENTTGRAYIGTHLFLKTSDGDQLLNIHLGPANVVKSFVENLEEGQYVEVQGFRTEQMEAGNYIAREFSAGEQTWKLRDENLRPVWAGDRGPRRGRRF